jgi:hypothetical protein
MMNVFRRRMLLVVQSAKEAGAEMKDAEEESFHF